VICRLEEAGYDGQRLALLRTIAGARGWELFWSEMDQAIGFAAVRLTSRGDGR